MANPATVFIREAYNELKKATWMSKQQVIGSTIVVVILVCTMAVYVGAIDFVLSIMLGAFLGR